MNQNAKTAEKRGIEIFRVDPETEARQIERLERVRRERDSAKVEEALDRVRTAAETGENLMAPILDAVRVYATQGEICDALREVFGTYTPDPLTTGV